MVQRRSALREREIARSRQLAVAAQDLSASSPDEAGDLAVSAYRTADTAEARGALLSTAAYKPAREVFREHRGQVRAVAFDDGGGLLASAGDDGTVLLRGVSDGARAVPLDRDGGGVRALAFQPGHPLLASAGEDRQIVLWDVRTRTVVRVLPVPHGRVNAVTFSADGAVLAAGSQDGTVTVWDTARWREIARPPRRVGEVHDVAFSGTADLLAVAGATGVLLADRVRGGNRLFRDHDGAVLTVALSRDGHTLASGGDDQQVALRDLTGDAAPAFLRRHVSPVRHVEFTADGTRLLSAGADGSIRWWSAPGGGYLTAVASRTEPFFAAALSPDGERLAAVGDESVSLWRKATPSFTGHTRPPDALAFSADGDLLATGGSDSTIVLWNRDGRARRVIETRTPVTALAFRPDGTLVAGDLGGVITLWDAGTGTATRTLATHRGAVAGLSVDPSGRLVVSGGRDHRVMLTDLAGGAAARVLPVGHRGPVNAVAFDGTGQLVASGGADGRVAIWDVGHDRPLGPLVDGGTAIKSVTFSTRGPLLVTGDAAGDVVLWNSADRTRTGTLHSHGASRSVAISTDGRSLAVAGSDSLVTVWRIDGGRPVAALAGHTGPVNAVAFAPGGRDVLASAGPDPRIVLWDLDPAVVTARLCSGCH
ncbi:WD40 repeat domain-containing protein [Actinoplanes sp. NPDC026623]|uniref:WD40 repeat domain-containing protein n=1 Tax=Actinoplanes sp. NPDC026623 TaxID=3155610 RepID=UPI0033F9A61E